MHQKCSIASGLELKGEYWSNGGGRRTGLGSFLCMNDRIVCETKPEMTSHAMRGILEANLFQIPR